MKRKVYESERERKHDERTGAGLFLVINLLVGGVTVGLLSPGRYAISQDWIRDAISLAPWVVNGLFLLWSFIFRPHLGIGYLKCVATILIVGLGLSAIFFCSCIAAAAAGNLLGPLALAIFIGLLLGGLFYFFKWTQPLFSEWWSDTEN